MGILIKRILFKGSVPYGGDRYPGYPSYGQGMEPPASSVSGVMPYGTPGSGYGTDPSSYGQEVEFVLIQII